MPVYGLLNNNVAVAGQDPIQARRQNIQFRLQELLNNANRMDIQIPQDVIQAIIGAAAPRNGNNAEMRRAKEWGARKGAIFMGKLIESKRALLGAARAAQRGSLTVSKKIAEKAARLAREAYDMAPERQVIKNYANNLLQYAKGLVQRISNKGKGAAAYASNLIGRLYRKYKGQGVIANRGGWRPLNNVQPVNRRHLPPSLRGGHVNAPSNQNKTKIRHLVSALINNPNNSSIIREITGDNRFQVYANKNIREKLANVRTINYKNKLHRVLRQLTKLPSNVKRPVVNNLNKYLENERNNHIDVVSQDPLEKNYLIIDVGNARTRLRLNPESLQGFLAANGKVGVEKNNLRNWLRMAKRNFKDENLFKHPILRNRWVRAGNIKWAKGKNSGAGPSRPQQNENLILNNSNLIKNLVRIRLTNLTINSPVLDHIKNLNKNIPEFATCIALLEGARNLPGEKFVKTRVISLLRLILFRKNITNTIKSYIRSTWPRSTNNMTLRAIAQNIGKVKGPTAPRVGIGLNIADPNMPGISAGIGLCHFEGPLRTNVGRVRREEKLNDLRKVFHSLAKEFISKSGNEQRRFSQTFAQKAVFAGPCMDATLRILRLSMHPEEMGPNNY
jgi:hypothetical protein